MGIGAAVGSRDGDARNGLYFGWRGREKVPAGVPCRGNARRESGFVRLLKSMVIERK